MSRSVVRTALVTLVAALVAGQAHAQNRRMEQDSTLNNLVHPPGTVTVPLYSLGNVQKVGEGARTMLLIPGFGFGNGIWTEFMEQYRSEFTMYAVTLPGFGGTAPLPMPDVSSSYADAPWTRSAIKGIVALLDRDRVQRVTIVAHWALATQIALRLAIDNPDRVDAVVLIGGVLKALYDGVPGMKDWSPQQRAASADMLAARWFRTVTRETWDDNNFMSYDYAVNPRRGLFLWREAQAPTLPVWVRYLQEFSAVDVSGELKRLRVPVLVVRPGFDDTQFYVEPDRDYMRSLTHRSWDGAQELSKRLEFITIPHSRLFVMYDQPDALHRAVRSFLARTQER